MARPRLAWALAIPCVLLAVAVPAAISMAGDDGSERTTVAAAGLPASTVPASTVPATTTTKPPATTTTTTPPPATATTTTAAPRTTTTTAAPRTTTTTQPPASTTTTTTDPYQAPGPHCEPSMFHGRLTADKASYKPDETVVLSVAYTNVSSTTCYWVSGGSGLDVLDAAGKALTQGLTLVVDNFEWVPQQPGSIVRYPERWTPLDCAPEGLCRPAPPGTYAIVHRGAPFGTARTTVQLVAG